jgi:hypothetical protein
MLRLRRQALGLQAGGYEPVGGPLRLRGDEGVVVELG